MSAAPACSLVAAKAALDALLALLNVNAPGHIKIYTGAPPGDVETGATGTLLATLALSATAFPASANNGTTGAIATANAITSGVAGATGTAGYLRACDGNGLAVVQGNIATSAADFVINSTSITSGDTVAVSAWTVTLPNGGA
jgi:hypothetical protein